MTTLMWYCDNCNTDNDMLNDRCENCGEPYLDAKTLKLIIDKDEIV